MDSQMDELEQDIVEAAPAATGTSLLEEGDQPDDTSGRLALTITSDEDSRESAKVAKKESPQEAVAFAPANAGIDSNPKHGIPAPVPLKRRRSILDWSSDEEDFAGFDECNGDSSENSYKRIKEELPSEGEQDHEQIKSHSASEDPLKSVVKSELDEAGDENKPPDVSEIPEDRIDEKHSASHPASSKQRSIKDPIYKKPFALGWKREVVYRAIPGISKDKGEVYYITPMGKKIRTRTELQLHLTHDLQLENFTFAREPIGMSLDEEKIRVAKPTARTVPAEVTLGKRIPKPKGPKGASPPPQGWTPARAVKSSSISSPRSLHATRMSDENENKSQASSKSTPKTSKLQKKGEPCSIECVLAMGTIPQLQCVKCLCLYHHECIGTDANTGSIERGNSGGMSSGSVRGDGGYICEYCKNKTPPPSQPKPVQQSPPKTNQATINSVGSIQSQRRESETIKESSKASNKTSSNGTKNSNNHTDPATTLPQSIAVIKGRKYVVIRKPSSTQPDGHSKDATNENSSVNQSSVSLTTGEDVQLRKRGTSARSSKSSENVQLTETSSQPPRQQPITVHSETFATHFFSNVSTGYQILLQTFQYLKVQELLRAACVCRLWNVAANHRSLWRTVRMKNSQVNDWTGLAAALKRNGTQHLDLRKMISSANSEEMWSSFSKNIKEVESLEIIDLCRCSSQIVEDLFISNPKLKVVNAIAIKDDTFNLENVHNLESLEEFRLKSIDGFSLESDLHGLKMLKNLRHLSLTSVRGLGTKDVSVLGELTNLESLDLGECCDLGTSFATDVLVNLVHLNRLRLEKGQENCCTIEILEAVSQLEQLQQLELVNFDIKTGFDEKMSKCKHLKRLLLIPTYISQSATTNNIVLSAVLNLSETLQFLTWVVTLELLRVTALYVDQCDNKKKDKKFFDESIPVLKPVPGIVDDLDKAQKTASDVPQVEILPLVRVEEILIAGMPTTKFKILKVPYHATWRQNLVDIKDDPLKRIQEEINEVARREQELREKMQLQQKSADSHESPSPMPTDEASNCAGTEEVHSDDSGISASSSPINGTSANTKPAYIRPSSYSVSAKLPQQKFLLRASSTPQITLTGRRFNISPAQKGIMQRFIASRGKLGTPSPPNNQYMHSAPIQGRDNGNPLTIELNRNNLDFLKAPIVTPPIIERDQDGRPIRRGFVPVEEKIQKELRDLKTRESELKRQRKLRQSQPDILDSIEDEEYQSDDSDVEHCFAPGKLRATKSISELCDNTSISPSITPSPNFDRKTQNHQGMRPAISLAQLCDLDPEEAPSSHDLIAKWESLIQKNA